MRTLRPYQSDAVAAVRRRWSEGQLRTSVVMATGLGKTDVIAHLATERVRAGHRALILAHRRELLEQIEERCRQHYNVPGLVGFVQGEQDQTARPITVASVATLRNVKRQRRICRTGEVPYTANDLVIVDECHHAAAKSYLDVMRWAGCWERTPALGVTATMYRTARKGLGLGDVWGSSPAFSRDIGWAIDHGWLVRPRGLSVVADHLDLSKVTTRNGDYADGELGEMVAQDADQIADSWVRHGEGRRTAAFFPTVEAAKEIACALERRGVTAELVTGDTPHRERRAIYARLGAGATRVVANCMVLTEGWDCPPVSCILMGRPTKVDGLYQQIVGRGLRLHPGKDDCLVLDVVGATRSRSLRTLADMWRGADYQEADPRPCEMCRLYRRRPKDYQGAIRLCTCPKLERPDARPKLEGPASYAAVDLLADAGFLWLETKAGIPFIPADDRYGVLWRHRDETWTALHVSKNNRQEKSTTMARNVSLNVARRLVEAWAGRHASATYVRRDAAWRKGLGAPSEGQVRVARNLGIAEPERYSKAALSDLMSVEMATRRLDRRG